MDRLGRYTLALVLSSGGARGVAHIGVLKALAALHIRPDIVVGSSAGAFVGLFYCAGMSPEEMEREVRTTLRWSVLGRLSVINPVRGWRGVREVESFLSERVGDLALESLPIPLAAVATDLASGRAVVFTRGSAVWAVRASIGVPGLFPRCSTRTTSWWTVGCSTPCPWTWPATWGRSGCWR